MIFVFSIANLFWDYYAILVVEIIYRLVFGLILPSLVTSPLHPHMSFDYRSHVHILSFAVVFLSLRTTCDTLNLK